MLAKVSTTSELLFVGMLVSACTYYMWRCADCSGEGPKFFYRHILYYTYIRQCENPFTSDIDSIMSACNAYTGSYCQLL